MVGYEDYSYTYETMSGSTNDMSLSSFPYLDLANKNALAVAGNSYQNAYRSFFGRVMYNYDSREVHAKHNPDKLSEVPCLYRYSR